MFLDVHSINSSRAFLRHKESHASFSNSRGTLKLRMSSGTCNHPSLSFDGTKAAGEGTWAIERGVGAYRDATGTGTFDVNAEVGPGADNDFDLTLSGDIDVSRPRLGASLVRAFWGNLGADYLRREVSAVVRITNLGPGDAFGARFLYALSSNSSVKFLGPKDVFLGDLAAGKSEDITLKYYVGPFLQPLSPSPCGLVILGCEFHVVPIVVMPDALDRPSTLGASMNIRAPAFPPPL